MLYVLKEDSGSMPGVLANILILAAVIALALSTGVLSLYRRAVKRFMRMHPMPESSEPTPVRRLDCNDPTVYLACVPEGAPEPKPLTEARSYQRRLAAVYAAAGLCCAFTLTMAILVQAGVNSWFGGACFIAVGLWPAVLCLDYILGWNWWIRRRNELIYFCGLLVLGWITQQYRHNFSLAQMGLLFAINNVPATLLVFAFSSRPLRGIGPTIFPLCVAGVAGAWMLVHLAATNLSISMWISKVSGAIGLSANGTVAAIYVVGLAAMIPVGWIIVLWIVRRYRAKRISDQSLLLDLVWLLFVTVSTIVLATPVSGESGRGISWLAAAFPIYLAARSIGFYNIRKLRAAASQKNLLVIRSFGLDSRAERVFRAVALFWRYLGHVRLIGGPDMAASTLQPHSLLDFASGRLRDSFINSSDVLDSRILSQEGPPDPDGRFRIVEFFCFDDTWRSAVSRLIKSSHVVLADLRGFPGDSRGGCEFEIREVLNALAAERLVVLVDDGTDRKFLAAILQEIWNSLASDSPNLHRRNRSVRTVDYSGGERRAVYVLLKALFAALDTEPFATATATSS